MLSLVCQCPVSGDFISTILEESKNDAVELCQCPVSGDFISTTMRPHGGQPMICVNALPRAISFLQKGEKKWKKTLLCQCPASGDFISTLKDTPIILMDEACQCPASGDFISTGLTAFNPISRKRCQCPASGDFISTNAINLRQPLSGVSMPCLGLFHFYWKISLERCSKIEGVNALPRAISFLRSKD